MNREIEQLAKVNPIIKSGLDAFNNNLMTYQAALETMVVQMAVNNEKVKQMTAAYIAKNGIKAPVVDYASGLPPELLKQQQVSGKDLASSLRNEIDIIRTITDEQAIQDGATHQSIGGNYFKEGANTYAMYLTSVGWKESASITNKSLHSSIYKQLGNE